MIVVVLITWIALELLFAALIALGLMITAFFVTDKVQIYYDNWKALRHCRKLERNYEEYLQRKRKRELRIKEMEKYPLFFWKDTAKMKKHPGIDKWR